MAELYWDARSKGLDSFQKACAAFIAAHIHEVAEAAPTDPLGPILSPAAARTVSGKGIKIMQSDLEEIKQLWPDPCSHCKKYHFGNNGLYLLSEVIGRVNKLV